MAVTASRTLANVKSSAIRPRQPEVPNFIGEFIFAEAVMDGYSTRSGIVHKDEGEREKDARFGQEGLAAKCFVLLSAQCLFALSFSSTFTVSGVTERNHGPSQRALSNGLAHLHIDGGSPQDRALRGGEET